MKDRYSDRYRIESARAWWWDYSSNGRYFITICTDQRACTLGKISNGQWHASPLGEIVEDEWQKSFEIRSELICDAFVLMPNHLHALLRLAHPPTSTAAPRHDQPYGIAYRPPRSISSFVAGFKSAATKRINALRQTPGQPVWQTRFYDRIVRDETEFARIATYIAHNPANWSDDEWYNT